MTQTLRSCGTCFACCKYTGIDELRKYPNVACKHLDGSRPEHRCSIYPRRPIACATYACAWLNGLGNDLDRPDLSGILVTPYAREDVSQADETLSTGDKTSITIVIIDTAKSGDLVPSSGNVSEMPPLMRMVDELCRLGVNDIRVVNFENQAVVHFHDGLVRNGNLLTANGYESLSFATFDPPIGRYEVQDDLNPEEKKC